MNLLFWKKKKTEPEESREQFLDKTDDETATAEPEEAESIPDQPGILARVRTKLAAAGQRLRRRREYSAAEDESPTAGDAPGKTSVEASAEDAIITNYTVKPRKRLLLAGALVVFILLTAGGGFAAWKWLLVPAPADMRVQIEALKKQNREMQAQIEALKKDSQSEPQPATAAVENRPSGKWKNTALPPGQGVLIISDKDTTASAQALKQAIEEMNAASQSRNTKKSTR
jgi:hypothetical protein